MCGNDSYAPHHRHRDHLALLGNMKVIRIQLLLTVFFYFGVHLHGNEEIAKYEEMAAGGDVKAMITLGLFYHQGNGVPVSYEKAMDWYLKAYDKNDGDAFNNIAVMYRDGLSVEKNEKIAYLLFLMVHMNGMGTDATQMRTNRSLRRLIARLEEMQIKEALSYTWAYVDQVVRSRGKDYTIDEDVLPSKERLRFKDANWWLPSEEKNMEFEPTPPWDKEVEDSANKSVQAKADNAPAA